MVDIFFKTLIVYLQKNIILGKSNLNILLGQLGLENTVFFRNEENSYLVDLHNDTKKKLELIKPDAIFVFNNQPFILFFDLTYSNLENEKTIHKQVWSFDNSPVVFILKEHDIKIYNALNYSKKENSLEEIKLSELERNEKFSFWNLQSGTTWKWLQQDYFENNRKKESRKRVNERLFENIKAVRKSLIDEKKDPQGSLPNSLILRLIFIRYLIDRGVKLDTSYINGNDLNARRKSFAKLIESPTKLDELFHKLDDNFNGVLFREVDIHLNSKQAKSLAQIFRGEIPEEGTLFAGGDFYFDVFDFSIIPVEVISGIYESLIDPETRNLHSAVYTPSFLVEYILSDTVDIYLKENNSSNCKIFEVAVGSGIFLVQSLRRMIEKEIELNGNSNKITFSERIREIVKNNLFGIDINKEALKVTCFSIYIALLDYQEPKDIEKYPFPNLIDENLFEADFFNVDHKYNNIIKSITPDYILGNPPWKKDKSKLHLDWVNSRNIYSKKINGELEIAQSFLIRACDFMQQGTKAALIVTSTLFYNVSSTSKEFKNKFLTEYCINKFFDLSPVRRLIFEEKDSPASIVYFSKSQNSNYLTNVIQHQSVKSNSFLKHFKMLVIEKFDYKNILQRHFIENDWMFKIALYGNTLDFNLLKRLEQNKTKINNYIDNKTVFGGAGIHKGTKNKFTSFPYILNKHIIENSEIENYYSFSKTNNNIINEEDSYIKSGREKGLYEGVQILIKEQAKEESQIITSLTDKEYVFRSGVFSISSSINSEIIKRIYGYLISDIYQYYIYSISGSWGTSTRPQIRWKEEYLSFPIIEFDNLDCIKFLDLVNKFIQSLIEKDKNILSIKQTQNISILNQINEMLFELYEIKEHEKDLIDYVLKISRYQFQESKQHLITDFTYLDNNHYRNRDNVLKSYAEIYINEFKYIYQDEFLQIEIYPLDYFIAMNFVFLDKQPDEKIIFPKDKNDEKAVLLRLANNISISQITNTTDPSKNLYIQKDLKGFEDNSFYIIKPNEYKCWHKAMAWYDVAEFKETIEAAEFDHLNGNENGK